MIVRMKKVSLVIFDSVRESALRALKKLGVMHLETLQGSSENLTLLIKNKQFIQKCIALLPDTDEHNSDHLTVEEAIQKTGKIISLSDQLKNDIDVKEKLEAQKADIQIWGDFDPKDLSYLKNKGISIRLLSLSAADYKSIEDKTNYFVINNLKTEYLIAAVNIGDEEFTDRGFELPAFSLSEIEKKLNNVTDIIHRQEKEFQDLSKTKKNLVAVVSKLEEELEFENIRSGLNESESLCYLKGYIPVDKVDSFKEAAAENGWAYIIDDPAKNDNVPTLVKRKGPAKLSEPIFSIMGVTPGYNEVDISLMFLIAFSLFVAIIVGDAGYGFAFLGLTVYARKKNPQAPKEPFLLMGVMWIAAIIWGSITGTWFGSVTLAQNSFLSKLVIPEIASFPKPGMDTAKNMMIVSFIIGLLHLSIACIEMFIRGLPKLKSYSQVGWLCLIWGLFALVMDMVLGMKALFGFDLTKLLVLIPIGLGFVVVFGNQEGDFIKGVLKGLNPLNIFINALDTVGAFSNIISYVRLFAVGLATVAVAANFNEMAMAGNPTGLAWIKVALIMFLGHSINMIMAVMSIAVHGLRLNMLEYSGQIGLEWSGYEYNPFRKKVIYPDPSG